MRAVTIREPELDDAVRLAAMLSEDDVLRGELGMAADDRPDAEAFLRKLADWCPPRRATTFAILMDDRAVGTISLSHHDPEARSARIGYWVGSRHRRYGCATLAFVAILDRAAEEGIETVSATIPIGNKASRRMWMRMAGHREWELRIPDREHWELRRTSKRGK